MEKVAIGAIVGLEDLFLRQVTGDSMNPARLLKTALLGIIIPIYGYI